MDIKQDYHETLVSYLDRRSLQTPDENAFTFLVDGEKIQRTMTWKELNSIALNVAQGLLNHKLQNERVLLLLPPGFDFVIGFFSCLYAGTVSVPGYPPRNARNLSRIESIANDSTAKFALTTRVVMERIKHIFKNHDLVKNIKWLILEDLMESQNNINEMPILNQDTLAFLQYTSGSTGNPKGVMINHANLLYNALHIEKVLDIKPNIVGVFWVPPYHDLGLMAGIIQPLFTGFHCYLMTPAAFLQRPSRWLKAISKFKGCLCGGPNFAFELCVNNIREEDCRDLDLSNWEIAFNGAEPIRHSTMERFVEKFKPYGFKKSAINPCYGLAEATLFVSGTDRKKRYTKLGVDSKELENSLVKLVSSDARHCKTLVSSGSIHENEDLKIVKPNSGLSLEDGCVGEICVAGPNIAKGYWKNKKDTDETFIQNWVTGQGSLKTSERYLRTGDLGFIFNNELYVTGRIKDLIIIRGRNFYPHDIEALAATADFNLNTAASAAFSYEESEQEKICLVQELRFKPKSLNIELIAQKIRSLMIQSFDITIDKIIFIRSGTLPKTSSGKVRRRECRKRFLNNTLVVVGENSISSNANLVSNNKPENMHALVLSLSTLDEQHSLVNAYLIDTIIANNSEQKSKSLENYSFTDLGLDSIAIVGLQEKLQSDFGVRISSHVFYEISSISKFSYHLIDKVISRQKSQIQDLEEKYTDIIPAVEEQYLPFRLTDIQQAYWIGRQKQFDLGNVSAHGYLEVDCENLDMDKLNDALNILIKRHPMLRAIVDDNGYQRILANVPTYEIKINNLASCRQEFVSEQLEKSRDILSHEVLPTDKWPLFTIQATLISKNITRLHLSFDLLIADAWSFSILSNEWETYYHDLSKKLRPIEIGFRDYVMANVNQSDRELYDISKEYWLNKIDNLPPPPQLPLIKNITQVKKPRFSRRNIRIDISKWNALKDKCKHFGITPSALLLAAFCLIINKWSSNTRFSINLTTFNRPQRHYQIDEIIGDFTSMILVDIDCTKNDSFSHFTQYVQKNLIQALEHRHYPGTKVLREIMKRSGRNNSATMPIVFTSMLGHGTKKQGANELFGWLGKKVYSLSQTPQVFFDHQVSEENGSLECSWDIIDELFPVQMIDDMFHAYQKLLLKLSKNDSFWLQEQQLELLPKNQADRVNEINNNDREYPDKRLESLFLEQASRVPENYAVISSYGKLTYKELASKSINLAHLLSEFGVSKNKLVAIIMKKSWEQVSSVLAIHIAGSAYLPISHDIPLDRINKLLQQGGVKVILTHSSLKEKFNSFDNYTIVYVDESLENKDNSQDIDVPPTSLHHSEDLAYVIFTSGSTGVPKGVAIEHQGAVNTILDMNSRWKITDSDRVLAISSLTFDLSVYDIFGPLAAGGSIVIPDEDGLKDPAHWCELIKTHKVTVWNTVPALMEMLTVYALSHSDLFLDSLRTILLSGDWIPLSLPQNIRKITKNPNIISLGGATEASIWSIYFEIEKIDSTWKSIPYGKPLSNQTFYVYDNNMELCPDWVEGELYIGGIGLAQKYWEDNVQTNSRFIIHPKTKKRLYKTGDMGRYMADGNIEFLGRVDNQVKIRGFRVELGEIEAALRTHQSVHEAISVLHKAKSGKKSLIGYWLAKPNEQVTEMELKTHVEKILPQYMVPEFFIPIKSMPLTANGKINRGALPIPEQFRVSKIQQCVEPTTENEQLLSSIWKKVLGVKKISIHDDFFESGGDSILVTRVIAQLQETGYQLSMRQFFSQPTIWELSTSLRLITEKNSLKLPEIEEIPLLPIQKWFFNLNVDKSHPHSAPFIFEVPADTDYTLLHKAVDITVEHHDAFKLTFHNITGEWIQKYNTGHIEVPFKYVEFTQKNEFSLEDDLHKTIAQVHEKHLLDKAPLVSVAYLDYGFHAVDYVIISVHHLVIDGISWQIFLQDIKSVYQQLSLNLNPAIPKSVTSYHDWALFLKKYANSTELRKEISYWISSDRKHAPLIPVQQQGSYPTLASSSKVIKQFSTKDTSALLNGVCINSGIKIHHVLLWSLVKTLTEMWTQGSLLLVDIRGHGREIPECPNSPNVSRTIGWFNAIYPVLFNIKSSGVFDHEIKQIIEQLDGVPNNGIGYGILRYLQSDKHLRETFEKQPQAGVCFNYLGQLDSWLSDDVFFKQIFDVSMPSHNKTGYHPHFLDVKGGIYGGKLMLEFRYSKNIFQKTEIENLLEKYVENCHSLISKVKETKGAI